MSDGSTFTKGFRSAGSTDNIEDFTPESMLIGLKGNENPSVTAIGFIRYTCMPPIIDPSKTTPGAPTSLTEVVVSRTKTTLGLSWTAPVLIDGAVIIDYRVNVAEQGQSSTVAATGVTSTSYTVTGLTAGKTYEFNVEARNSYGYSSSSGILTLLCAFVPDSPTTITTANVNDKVSVSWNEPVTNGSPITAYKIFIRRKDLTFNQESVECVGTNAALIADRTCSVALATLKASPYSLVKGDSVVAQIFSVNVYGDSVQVVSGDGALIRDLPDPPLNLANDPTTTSDTVIRFTFSEGASNGGTAVTSYTIFYDQGSNTFVQLASGVTNLFY